MHLVGQAAKKFGYERYFFQRDMAVEDDHLPFVERGVPSIDVIDLDYGPNNSYHHTAQDTWTRSAPTASPSTATCSWRLSG